MDTGHDPGTYHQQLADILAPKLTGCRTVCDAGCGLGALSAALSSRFDAITAADVSDDALDVLRRTILARGLTNITPLHCDLLSDALTEQYDGMVFCFFGSLAEILPVARRQCAKTLVIIKKNYALHRFSLTVQHINDIGKAFHADPILAGSGLIQQNNVRILQDHRGDGHKFPM